jgi:hypothetical protein
MKIARYFVYFGAGNHVILYCENSPGMTAEVGCVSAVLPGLPLRLTRFPVLKYWAIFASSRWDEKIRQSTARSSRNQRFMIVSTGLFACFCGGFRPHTPVTLRHEIFLLSGDFVP